MPELRCGEVVLRPVDERDAAALREIHAKPEVAAWWGRPPDGFPFADDPDATRFAILHDGESAGLIQYGEAGFRRVGVMRRASRVPGSPEWRDTLLMELVST